MVVRLKDWCIDAVGPEVVGAFWAAALGLEARPHPTRPVVGLWRDEVPVIWVNGVDHPKVVKDRVHPDLRAWSPDDLEALGAVTVADHGDWRVMADPEGNEMCAFPADRVRRPDDPPAELFAWCVDSERPVEAAAWWAHATGAQVVPGPDGALRWLRGTPGLDGALWKFVPVADERVVENRVHWDVVGDAEALVAAGATLVRRPDHDIFWTVLRDPEGNVFCCFAP